MMLVHKSLLTFSLCVCLLRFPKLLPSLIEVRTGESLKKGFFLLWSRSLPSRCCAMSSSSSSSIVNVRFLIDKERKRVVFVEAGSAFIDVLFSFLTLPLGSIVRLLNKHSGFGSLDNLYESVVQLDAVHLQTEACREMLLHPWSAAAGQCRNLKIKYICELYPGIYYTCLESDCLIQSTYYFAYTSKVQCKQCGKLMDTKISCKKETSEEGKEGIFVNDTFDFIITDDLRVMPSSYANGLSILKELQIEDASILEERVIDFGTKEVLNLLERSLVSKNALTEFFFPGLCVEASELFDRDSSLSNKDEIGAGEAEAEVENEIIMELFLDKRNNEVLCAEVGEDFVNLLFSFLTFPLGSALGFLPDNMFLFCGCIHNLYSSAKSMSADCFESEICRDRLLTPKLPAFYEYKKHILKMKEVPLEVLTVLGSCVKCFARNGCKRCKISPCPHGIAEAKFTEQNPKSAKGVEDYDGAFVVSSKRFMISDNLRVSPLSLISHMRNEIDFPISELVRKEVTIDKTKALSLLRALLVSKKVLTDVFYPKPIEKYRS